MSEYELELRQCKAAFEILKLFDKQHALKVAAAAVEISDTFGNVPAAMQTIKSHAYLVLGSFFSDSQELADFISSFNTSENPELLVASLRGKLKEVI